MLCNVQDVAYEISEEEQCHYQKENEIPGIYAHTSASKV